ncbi:MAG: hypothetical protein ACK4GQ_03430, partial [Candidatus Hadarchaeales archaeon]
EVNLAWASLEYLKGWGEAISTGVVRQSGDVSAEFFRVAWAIHEYNTFGSFDYPGAAAEIGQETKDFIFSGSSMEQNLAEELDALARRLEGAEERLKDVEKLLRGAVGELELAEGHLRDNSGENFLAALERASRDLQASGSGMVAVKEEFNLFLSDAASLSAKDSLMAATLSGIFQRKVHRDLPSMKEQVEWALGAISKTVGEVQLSENMSGEALALAREKILAVLRDEGPVGWVEVRGYENSPPREVEKRLPVYVSEDGGKTIPNLLSVFEGGRRDLGEMAKLTAGASIPFDQKMQEFLTASWGDLGLSRENMYLIFSPPPIKDDPGLSVFHQLNLGKVEFSREDIAGLLGQKFATPIYLPFANTVLWWGQWEVKIKMRGGVERIFDFKNQTVIQPSILGPAHASLSYRWTFDEREFKTRVVVVSPRYFEMV